MPKDYQKIRAVSATRWLSWSVGFGCSTLVAGAIDTVCHVATVYV